MTTMLYALILFALAGVTVCVLLRAGSSSSPVATAQSPGKGGQIGDWPDPLAGARLVLSECTLKAPTPVRIPTRMDQVYLTPDRHLVPLETKTRKWNKVYLADIIQLSIQAYILGHVRHPPPYDGRPVRVAPFGFVRVVVRGATRPVYRRVNLWSWGQVEGYVERVYGLRSGAIVPEGAQYAGFCRTCPYESQCEDSRL